MFELGMDVPYVASVSGHRQWNQIARYTHLKGKGDAYKEAPWIESVGIKKPPITGGNHLANSSETILH